MKKMLIDPELHTTIEDYSCKAEQLRNFIDFINEWVWNQVSNGNIAENETSGKLCSLMENLSDLAHLRDSELVAILDSMAHG